MAGYIDASVGSCKSSLVTSTFTYELKFVQQLLFVLEQTISWVDLWTKWEYE